MIKCLSKLQRDLKTDFKAAGDPLALEVRYPASKMGILLRPRFAVLAIFSLNALIGVTMVAFLEPAMNIDSAVLAAFHLNDWVVPHFPFGYFLIRIFSQSNDWSGASLVSSGPPQTA
jgi:hypothetical protein